MRVGQIKELILLVEKYYPEKTDELVGAEHGQIFLFDFSEDEITEEFKKELEKIKCFWWDSEFECITGFC